MKDAYLNLYIFVQAFTECIAKCFTTNLLGLVNMSVVASTGLYEPYRLNRKKKASGLMEEGGDIRQQEMKNKAETGERRGKGEKKQALESLTSTSRNCVLAQSYIRKLASASKIQHKQTSTSSTYTHTLIRDASNLDHMGLAAAGRVDSELATSVKTGPEAAHTAATVCVHVHVSLICRMPSHIHTYITGG